MKPRVLIFPILLVLLLGSSFQGCPIARTDGEPGSPVHAWNGADLPSRESWLTGGARQPDPAILVSAEALLREDPMGRETVLLDIRGQADVDQCRIPGSLHIPLHAVRTKEFLKPRRLVLVGRNGLDEREESECVRLNNEGFMASLLDGGISAWSAAGRPVEGDGCQAGSLNTISPVEWLASRRDERWLLVNACRSKQSDGLRLIPQALILPDPENLDVLRSLIGQRAAGRPVTLLLFDDDGSDIPRLAQALSKSTLPRVLFLEGGINHYQAFLERQAALFDAQRSSSRKASSSCASCP